MQHRFKLDIVLDMAQNPSTGMPKCKCIIKPDVVFFGESLPAKALEQAQKESSLCDLFFVIGSTLTVYPAALMPEYALSNGAKLVIINLSPTPLDEKAFSDLHQSRQSVAFNLPSIVEYISANPA